MVALGEWLLTIMKISVLGVIFHSICSATGNRTISSLVKLLAILLIVQVTFTTIAKPIQTAGKGIANFGKSFQGISESLNKWTNNTPQPQQPTDSEILWGPKKK